MLDESAGTETLLELLIEALAKNPGKEYEDARQDLEEIYQRFKFSSSFDREDPEGGVHDPIAEFLRANPSRWPDVAMVLTRVMVDYVHSCADRYLAIKEQRPLTASERAAAGQLFEWLAIVNSVMHYDENPPVTDRGSEDPRG